MLGTVAACDSAPGAASDPFDQRPPVLTDLQVSPEQVVLEELPPEQIEGETVRVPLTVSAEVSDPDDDLVGLSYVVFPALGGSEALLRGPLEPASDGRYAASGMLVLPASAVGDYVVQVRGVDAAGLVSNEVRSVFAFTSTNEPPVIEAVEATPDPLTPPATLVLIATVSDPNGLGNIARVTGRTPSGFDFELFDDGQSSGDATAGDGRFTASFDVPSATPGVQTFTFQAFDRLGAASEVFEKDVTIQ